MLVSGVVQVVLRSTIHVGGMEVFVFWRIMSRTIADMGEFDDAARRSRAAPRHCSAVFCICSDSVVLTKDLGKAKTYISRAYVLLAFDVEADDLEQRVDLSGYRPDQSLKIFGGEC